MVLIREGLKNQCGANAVKIINIFFPNSAHGLKGRSQCNSHSDRLQILGRKSNARNGCVKHNEESLQKTVAEDIDANWCARLQTAIAC